MSKLSLTLPTATLRDLRALARHEGRRMRAIVRDALRFYLAMPRDGREAIHEVQRTGTPAENERLVWQMARAAAFVSYQVAVREGFAASTAPELQPAALAAESEEEAIARSLVHFGARPRRTWTEDDWADLLRGRPLAPGEVEELMTPQEEASIAMDARRLTRSRGPLLPRWLPEALRADGYVGAGDEATTALRMRVLSAPKLCRYQPGADEIVVVLRNRGAAAVTLLPGWRAQLHLEADDTGRFAWTSDGIPLSATDAVQIVRFVTAQMANARVLVVACDAGVSRSRSVAAALADVFGLPYQWTVFERAAYAAVIAAAADISRPHPPPSP